MAGLTTHILDTHGGVPAAGVAITLRRITDGQAQTLAETVTNAD
ncbi:MAG: hydroxyisourate hydrolase, partial [Beijerinckiaceae bacterium]|nr:hydroxyisourate hydrolase [Beijerinckiaceae bacterium]